MRKGERLRRRPRPRRRGGEVQRVGKLRAEDAYLNYKALSVV